MTPPAGSRSADGVPLPGSTDAARPAPAAGRECDCPAYVERCAHLGTTRLILARIEGAPAHLPYSVGVASGPPSRDCGCGCGRKVWAVASTHSGYDYDAALAAFFEAEARLLQGEAPA